MYSKLEKAILFMQKANKGQKYKNTNIERTFHSLSVSYMIKDITNEEDFVIAALLHDIIADTEYGYDEIEEQFGTLVAEMVFELSEDMAITKWFERKKDYLQKLKKQKDINVLNIVLADKIHTLSMLHDIYKKDDDKAWKNTGGTKDENSYFYKSVYYIIRSKEVNKYLLERYKKIIKLYFGELDEESL